MPLAFSTLGCPGESLARVIGIAREAGATGLELRAADGEFVYPGMDAAACSAVASELADAGLEVLALASYVRVCASADGAAKGSDTGDASSVANVANVATVDAVEAVEAVDDGDARAGHPANDPVLAELLAAVDLAAALSAGNAHQGAQVRVFPGAGLEPCGLGEEPSVAMAAADLRAARRLNAAAGHARDRGVAILLETHDSHPRASDMARILAHVAAEAPVKVIWDLMHPWRHDEAPEQTAALLGEALAYAQYKDGLRTPGTHDVVLTLPGEGQLPLLRMNELASELAAIQGVSDPWISLEWERAWHPELPPVAQALAALKTLLA